MLPVLGVLFCLWYVKNATCDVVYSDYIRLVNSYLPDVYDPDKFFVPDVLTRILQGQTNRLRLVCPSHGGNVQPEQMGNAYKRKRMVPFLCLCLFLLP